MTDDRGESRLRELAREHPEEMETFARRRDDRLKDHLLDLLEEVDGG